MNRCQTCEGERAGKSLYCSDCNKARAAERVALWSQQNREKRNATSAKWRLNNPEKVKAQAVHYYAVNSSQRLVASRKWKTENRERYAEKTREWAGSNPIKRRAYQAKRRSCDGGYTAVDVMRILEAQGANCAYCKTFLDGNFHVDHVIPLSRGGDGGPDNICLACPACNLSKSKKLFGYEWCPCGAK